jgi:hypothetical protein
VKTATNLLYRSAVIEEMGIDHVDVVQLQTGEASLEALPDVLAIDSHT